MSEIPQELRMILDDVLLVDGYKVDMGAGGKIGEEFGKDGLMFFVTFEGRMNNSTERRTVHVMLEAKFGYELGDEIMSRLEEFIKLMKARSDGSP